MPVNLSSYYQQRINKLFEQLLPEQQDNLSGVDSLNAAMRYSVLSGGKRLRPLLVYGSGLALGLAEQQLDAAAMAVELLHCYSLIHDDLPAMDNDDLRRGQATVHIKYTEATAILAGDNLQAMAFSLLASQITERNRCNIRSSQILARAAMDMVKGQAMDISFEGKQPEVTQLEEMLQLKTGALISASTLLPTAYVNDLLDSRQHALADFSRAIGLAFQIRDDVLDVEGDPAVMGKPNGSDAGLDKASWPARFGMEPARVRIGQLYERAIIALEHFDEKADFLRLLAEKMITRNA